MSGFGERFRRAGYEIPKPLIEVEGRPIVGHVVDLYPGIEKVTFICNKQHIEDSNFEMESKLKSIRPDANIKIIEPHKLGPIHAILNVIDSFDPEEPVIVNYCDFTCIWDFEAFKKFVVDNKSDGCVIGYTGFHPHMLGSKNYAYVKIDNGLPVDIQEKQPYTKDPMSEFASSGSYYFSSVSLMRDCFEEVVAKDLNVNGEYYVSMAYKPLFSQNKNVSVFPVEHFMQWGTPEDLAKYNWFSSLFRIKNELKNHNKAHHDGSILMPMAGAGSRFQKKGYEIAKPYIDLNGKPMFQQAIMDLPATDEIRLITRYGLNGEGVLKTYLSNQRNATEVELDELTEGQAITCLRGLDDISLDQMLTVAACDNGMIYDPSRLQKLLENNDVDVIIWGARAYPGAISNPEAYGWIEASGENVSRVSVKKPLGSPDKDPVVIGTFTFKRAGDLLAAIKSLIDKNLRVNGEYYVDSAINELIDSGLKVVLFEVHYYLCWGTPEDLDTYLYWQDALDKFEIHSYSKSHDEDVM